MLYVITGTNTISEILEQRHTIERHSLFIPMMLMLLLGAFTKSAQFPFHIWLPKAMTNTCQCLSSLSHNGKSRNLSII